MQRRIIPDVIDGGQLLVTLTPGATALDAAQVMIERQVGAVLVLEQSKVIGIVSERDIVSKVVVHQKDPAAMPVQEIMTPDPQTIDPDARAIDALRLMQHGHFRHLPVVKDGVLHGMVSIRDIFRESAAELEEGLQAVETLVYGEHYGVN
ncbi:MAG: CBS domain-containing protein [Geminicoccaceae bacterium]